jgi:hypothetical protein
MSNKKEMPKQTLFGKLKKGEKISCQRDHLLAKWKDICDVFFLNTAHEDVLVDAPLSMGHITKQNQLQYWPTASRKLVWRGQTRCCHIICLKGRQ